MSAPITYATIPVELFNTNFQSKYEVEEYIRDIEEEMQRMRDDAMMYFFMTEPKKFCGEDEDPKYNIRNRYNEIFNSDDPYDPDYGMLAVRLFVARKILDCWDRTHYENGLEQKYTEYPAVDTESGMHGIEVINGDVFPVDGKDEFITKDSDEYTLMKAFKYVNVLHDGYTKKQFEEDQKRNKEEYEKKWSLK